MNTIYIRNISIDKDLDEESYYSHIPAISYVEKEGLYFKKPVTFFIGENGTGKSTLLEAIATYCGFAPEGGSRNFSFSTRDTHSDLYEHLMIAKTGYPKDGFFLRAESFYNVASYIEDVDYDGLLTKNSYGGKSLHKRSHGESFLALVKNRFRGKGLYLLDEPEAALSPTRLMELLIHIHDLVEDDSQFIISTHSAILMTYPDADIFEFSDTGIRKMRYDQSDHYKITKSFIDRPEIMYRHLFGEDEK